MISIALFEPEIPQNVGTVIRLGACLGCPIHIIEPCGFLWLHRHLKRAGMDYMDKAVLQRHASLDAFLAFCGTLPIPPRLVALEPSAQTSYTRFGFQPRDILVTGREADGFSRLTRPFWQESVRIPLQPACRSLNLAVATAMVTGEALRQLNP